MIGWIILLIFFAWTSKCLYSLTYIPFAIEGGPIWWQGGIVECIAEIFIRLGGTMLFGFSLLAVMTCVIGIYQSGKK